MKKIRFAQPKYIIPLILIPFNLFIFYMLKDSFSHSEEELPQPEEVETFNTNIPLPNLDKRPLKSKFESFRETFKYNRDFTAIKEIDRREELTSPMSQKEREILDSVNNALIQEDTKGFMARVKEQTEAHSSSSPVQAQVTPEMSEYELQMRLFKDQMNYIDSLSRQPEESPQKTANAKIDSTQSTASERGTALVHKTPHQATSLFNTLRPWDKDQNIQAIIDEDIKVYQGSRVRIRLLDDMYVDDHKLQRGNCLYGIITSFKPQRIEMTISSVLIGDQIIDVDLKVYDNDGLPGLYVPASQFREFTKDLASNTIAGQNFQFSDTPENQAEMIYRMAEKAFSTTTKTVDKSVRKNKARLKYNTVLFLVNSK